MATLSGVTMFYVVVLKGLHWGLECFFRAEAEAVAEVRLTPVFVTCLSQDSCRWWHWGNCASAVG